jgi:hypothetical protein
VHAGQKGFERKQEGGEDEPVPGPEAGEEGERGRHVSPPGGGSERAARGLVLGLQADGTLLLRLEPRPPDAACGPPPFLPKAWLVISANPANEPMTEAVSSGIISTF